MLGQRQQLDGALRRVCWNLDERLLGLGGAPRDAPDTTVKRQNSDSGRQRRTKIGRSRSIRSNTNIRIIQRNL